jgi:hypothetical protein
VHPPAAPGARLAQRLEEQLPVVIVPKNLFPPVPPRHDMVEGAGILNAILRGTEGALRTDAEFCQDLMPDPYFLFLSSGTSFSTRPRCLVCELAPS